MEAFNSVIAEANQDRLEVQGGACIMYTHLARGFWSNGTLDPRFQRLIDRLARKNGWFVPVTTLLDYLRDQRGQTVISAAQRRDLERRWLLSKLRSAQADGARAAPRYAADASGGKCRGTPRRSSGTAGRS